MDGEWLTVGRRRQPVPILYYQTPWFYGPKVLNKSVKRIYTGGQDEELKDRHFPSLHFLGWSTSTTLPIYTVTNVSILPTPV